jgi:hypothetical protein
MKTIWILLAMLVSTGVGAQSRPTTTAMNCAQASALVKAGGGVVLNTGPYTYDRYVSGSGFCGRGETTEPAWVPTADSGQCFVGYRCRGQAQRQSSR